MKNSNSVHAPACAFYGASCQCHACQVPGRGRVRASRAEQTERKEKKAGEAGKRGNFKCLKYGISLATSLLGKPTAWTVSTAKPSLREVGAKPWEKQWQIRSPFNIFKWIQLSQALTCFADKETNSSGRNSLYNTCLSSSSQWPSSWCCCLELYLKLYFG